MLDELFDSVYIKTMQYLDMSMLPEEKKKAIRDRMDKVRDKANGTNNKKLH